MNRVFVDTSALYAFLVPSDRAHRRARTALAQLRAARATLVTTSYVVLESYSLLQRREGRNGVSALRESLTPLLQVIWVDEELHERALDDVLNPNTREVSLVDAVSFAVMRAHRIDQAFAFDRDFEGEGWPPLA